MQTYIRNVYSAYIPVDASAEAKVQPNESNGEIPMVWGPRDPGTETAEPMKLKKCIRISCFPSSRNILQPYGSNYMNLEVCITMYNIESYIVSFFVYVYDMEREWCIREQWPFADRN